MILEVCCGNITSVANAMAGGAHRVELCSALESDGLTPSIGLIHVARRITSEAVAADGSCPRLHVLIRPREGDFVYDSTELYVMLRDILMAKEAGADGVVIGALTPEGDVDVEACRLMMEAAEGMQVTFHRAFDVCRNPLQALEDIISLGCHRLLTSGQAPSAEAGIPMLRQLVDTAAGRISIMPAAGVNELNAHRILQETGANEIHGSLRSLNEQGRLVTDTDKIAQILKES